MRRQQQIAHLYADSLQQAPQRSSLGSTGPNKVLKFDVEMLLRLAEYTARSTPIGSIQQRAMWVQA